MSISTLVGMGMQGRMQFVRRNRRDASEMIVAALVALAVIASLFLIFSESIRLLRVGLVVALWAVAVGSITMAKYRRESVLDKAKVKDLQTVYELQLEREIAARRVYELTVESRVRREVRADAEELAALRAELGSLRKNLEVLFGGHLPIDRVAIKAEATRVQELVGGYQPAASGLYIPGSQIPGSQSSTPTPGNPHPSTSGNSRSLTLGNSLASGTPTLASPFDDPITAETTVVSDVAVIAAEPVPTAPRTATPGPHSGRPIPEPEPEPGSRHARRAAEAEAEALGAHSTGRSVAEILAGMHSLHSAEAAAGRRRRAD